MSRIQVNALRQGTPQEADPKALLDGCRAQDDAAAARVQLEEQVRQTVQDAAKKGDFSEAEKALKRLRPSAAGRTAQPGLQHFFDELSHLELNLASSQILAEESRKRLARLERDVTFYAQAACDTHSAVARTRIIKQIRERLDSAKAWLRPGQGEEMLGRAMHSLRRAQVQEEIDSSGGKIRTGLLTGLSAEERKEFVQYSEETRFQNHVEACFADVLNGCRDAVGACDYDAARRVLPKLAKQQELSSAEERFVSRRLLAEQTRAERQAAQEREAARCAALVKFSESIQSEILRDAVAVCDDPLFSERERAALAQALGRSGWTTQAGAFASAVTRLLQKPNLRSEVLVLLGSRLSRDDFERLRRLDCAQLGVPRELVIQAVRHLDTCLNGAKNAGRRDAAVRDMLERIELCSSAGVARRELLTPGLSGYLPRLLATAYAANEMS